MLGRLSGTLISVTPPQILIDVAGVGYEVDLPITDFVNLPNCNQRLTIFTHLLIREDAHILFGFLGLSQRNCFRSLLKVSGIGPRTALALLSTFTAHELHLVIAQGDVNALCRTPGVGRKVAERLVLELKGKLLIEETAFIHTDSTKTAAHPLSAIRLDIANALTSLGYDNKQINSALKDIPATITDVSAGIKYALKQLLKHTT